MYIMKKIFLFAVLFFPCFVFAQSHITISVSGIDHIVNGSLIYSHRADKLDDCYLEITQDSIIYHSISWKTASANSPDADAYMKVGLLKKNAKKMDTHRIKEVTQDSTNIHYLLTITFTGNVLHQVDYLDGMQPVHNNKKTEIDFLFDSKEKAKEFLDEYFK